MTTPTALSYSQALWISGVASVAAGRIVAVLLVAPAGLRLSADVASGRGVLCGGNGRHDAPRS